jgi:hypothetical protein
MTHNECAQRNTFQAVLAANSESSFILFLYEDGGIEWIAGDNIDGTFLY